MFPNLRDASGGAGSYGRRARVPFDLRHELGKDLSQTSPGRAALQPAISLSERFMGGGDGELLV
jgi:hypothetical protein